MTQLRDRAGRFANPFAQAVDEIRRSSSQLHSRAFVPSPEALDELPDEPTGDLRGDSDDPVLWLVAIRGAVKCEPNRPPRRVVQAEYLNADGSRRFFTEVRGRFTRKNGVVDTTFHGPDVPRAVRVPEWKTGLVAHAQDISDEEHDRMKAVIEIHREQQHG